MNPNVDANIAANEGSPLDAPINMAGFATKISMNNQSRAGFQWDTTVVELTNGTFVVPEFYRLSSNNQWQPVAQEQVPTSTGLLDETPVISPRSQIAYLTPLEPDCHWQDPQSPWNSPGPSAGPFTVALGDGSQLTYYWYKFIDQPAIVHANLPAAMRQNLQERVELIQANWLHTDDYLPGLSSGVLVGLDSGLVVTPPVGMEIGYVPIVTRQEFDATTVRVIDNEQEAWVSLFPNPSNGIITLQSTQYTVGNIRVFDARGALVASENMAGFDKSL